MGSIDPRRVLRWDSWMSGFTMLAAFAGAGLVADWLDVAVWVPPVVGVALIPWVALLIYAERQSPLRKGTLRLTAFCNLAWVAVVVALGLVYPDALPAAGKWTVGIVTLGALTFGIGEALGLRRVETDGAST